MSIENELQQLERDYQAKKSALEEKAGENQESNPSKRDVLHQVVEDKIQQHAPSYQSSIKSVPHDHSTLPAQVAQAVQFLINSVFQGSLSDGISQAIKTDDPAIIDAFHDALVDELYSILIERKKLEHVK